MTFPSHSRVFTVLPAPGPGGGGGSGGGGFEGARISSNDSSEAPITNGQTWEQTWGQTTAPAWEQTAEWDTDDYLSEPMTITDQGLYLVWAVGTYIGWDGTWTGGYGGMELVRNGTEVVASCIYDGPNFTEVTQFDPNPFAFTVIECAAGDVLTVRYIHQLTGSGNIWPGGFDTAAFCIMQVGPLSCMTDRFDREVAAGLGWGTGPLGKWVFLPDGWTINNALTVTGGYAQFDPESSQTTATYGHQLHWKGYLASSSALPGNGTLYGDYYVMLDTGHVWYWDNSSWVDDGYQGADGLMMLLDSIPSSVSPASVEVKLRWSVEDTTTEGDTEAEPQFYLAANEGPTPTNPYAWMAYWHGVDIWLDKYWDPAESYFEAYGYGDDEPGDVNFVNFDGSAYNWGDIWNLHMKITGGRVQANVWPDGEAEPEGWMIQSGSASYAFPDTHGPIDTFYAYIPNAGQSVRVYEVTVCGNAGV